MLEIRMGFWRAVGAALIGAALGLILVGGIAWRAGAF